MAIYNITHHSIEDRISKKFQTLVVYGLSLLVAMHYALVHQRQLIVADVARIKT